MPFLVICGPHWGSFAVLFGEQFLSGDHLRPGSFAVLYSPQAARIHRIFDCHKLYYF